MNAEQRILAWLERADFDGTGCRHSQDTIAKAVGCSREHANRCLRNLTAAGRIDTEKERRAGCPWPCNVYRVRDWNPHKRAGVLGVLAAIRDARRTQCHTERTTTAEEGSYAPGTSSSVSPFTRCQHAVRASRIELRRNRVCDDCRRLLEENKQLLTQLRSGECENCKSFAFENAELTQEISGLMHTTRHQARSIAGLTSELRKVQSNDPASTEIEIVLANWKRHTGHPKAKTPIGGKRWVTVKKALKDHTLVELLEAIEGLALVPYVGNHGRKTTGKPAERYDDVEHALRDETTIQRFRSYRARAFRASASTLLDVYLASCATTDVYAAAVLGATSREKANGYEAAARERTLHGDTA